MASLDCLFLWKKVTLKSLKSFFVVASGEESTKHCHSHDRGLCQEQPGSDDVSSGAGHRRPSIAPLRTTEAKGHTSFSHCEDLVDDVFTATEQEIEDATKFMMERAKQVEPRNEQTKL